MLKAGWELKTLKNVSVDFGRGKSKHRPRNDMRLYTDGIYPFIQTGDIRNASHTVFSFSQAYNESGLAQSKIWPKGTVCITIAANIAETAILGFDACFPDSVIGVVVDENRTSNDYVEYLLQSMKCEIQSKGKGSAQANINMATFENALFPFPSLSEQTRIVAILDEAFANISQAVANAEKNLANARELFDSYLNEVFTRKGEGWEEKTLDELTEKITKGSSPNWQGVNYVDHPGVLFVTSENVGVNKILLDKVKYVDSVFNEKDKKSILKKGDVLTNIVGASIGRTAIFDRDDVANINQAICLIRCDQRYLNNKYIAYLLNSPFFRGILHDNEIDNARANLSLGFFRSLSIPFPSLEKQVTIVQNLVNIESFIQELEGVYRRKLAALAELKQALLQKAFTGELTANHQHPQ